jgi:hypothetical protein
MQAGRHASRSLPFTRRSLDRTSNRERHRGGYRELGKDAELEKTPGESPGSVTAFTRTPVMDFAL